jgi:hypothetical protein
MGQSTADLRQLTVGAAPTEGTCRSRRHPFALRLAEQRSCRESLTNRDADFAVVAFSRREFVSLCSSDDVVCVNFESEAGRESAFVSSASQLAIFFFLIDRFVTFAMS